MMSNIFASPPMRMRGSLRSIPRMMRSAAAVWRGARHSLEAIPDILHAHAFPQLIAGARFARNVGLHAAGMYDREPHGLLFIASSCRNASENPRTANFDAA